MVPVMPNMARLIYSIRFTTRVASLGGVQPAATSLNWINVVNVDDRHTLDSSILKNLTSAVVVADFLVLAAPLIDVDKAESFILQMHVDVEEMRLLDVD